MIQISDESPPPGSNEADTEQLDAVELNDLASEVKTKNGIVWRTSRKAWLLCHWARQLTERFRLMWQTGGRPILHRVAIVKLLIQHVAKATLGIHQRQSALLMVGLPVTHD